MDHVIEIQVPISNYMGDGVFHQSLFFKKCPSKDEFLEHVTRLDDIDRVYPEYLGTWVEVLEVAKLVDDWRMVYPGSLIATNTFVEHPKFGSQPFSWMVREVH